MNFETFGKKIISVAVITFNSKDTVEETLDSILNQSYGSNNIELVISDDASSDGTTEIIEKWINDYSCLFFDVLFFKGAVNKGVVHNVNMAWMNCSSDWIKTIAGDDLLLNNCIYDNVEYVSTFNDISFLFSQCDCFKVKDDRKIITSTIPNKENLDFFDKNAAEQCKYFAVRNFNIAPSSFIKREALAELGFANELFPMIEDLPLWIKATNHGYKLHYLDKKTILYRMGDSLSNSSERLINISFYNHLLILLKSSLIRTNVVGIINHIFYYDRLLELKSYLFIAKLTGNRRTILSKLLTKIFDIIRPRWIISTYHRVKRCFNER